MFGRFLLGLLGMIVFPRVLVGKSKGFLWGLSTGRNDREENVFFHFLGEEREIYIIFPIFPRGLPISLGNII